MHAHVIGLFKELRIFICRSDITLGKCFILGSSRNNYCHELGLKKSTVETSRVGNRRALASSFQSPAPCQVLPRYPAVHPIRSKLPGIRFSKTTKHFGRVSGNIRHFLSSKGNLVQVMQHCNCLFSLVLKICSMISFSE